MQGNKRYFIFILLVSLTIGCRSTYKFKPQRDEYHYFFGIKLPVLSNGQKQFIVTDKMKKAIKNAKDFEWKRDELYNSLKKKYLLVEEESYYLYNNENYIRYNFFSDGRSIYQKNYFITTPYLEALKKQLDMQIICDSKYNQNGNIVYYSSNILCEMSLGSNFPFGKKILFDNKGILIFEIDYEKKFNMKFTEVFELVSNKLPKYDEKTKITLKRFFDEENGYWIIIYGKSLEKITSYNEYISKKVLIIDDKTQKIVFEQNIDPNHDDFYNINQNDILELYIKSINKQYNVEYLSELEDKFNSIYKNI